MIEVAPGLFVGGQEDFKSAHAVQGVDHFLIITAARDPWHREALGYKGPGAPKNSPEYLVARRGGWLILNLVDAKDVAYIPHEVVETAISAIHEEMVGRKRRILIHCNQGRSRAPSLALLYLARYTDVLSADYGSAMIEFKRLYPDYAPAQGMADYVRFNWAKYAHDAVPELVGG